ncbi:MAG: PfkB family carbohydrate kinase, partial [Pseudomonadota bacterium]
LVKDVDIVIASSDFMPPCCNTREDVIKFFVSNNIDKFAITAGSQPIEYYSNGSKNEIFVPEVEVIDSLAAGDVFHGAFCYFYLEDNNFKNALRDAAKIASFSCEFFARDWIKNL